MTRTAGILIHSRLKALAVNLVQPSGRLYLYAGLIGSNNSRFQSTIKGMSFHTVDLVICANPSPSSFPHGCEGVNVSSGTSSLR